MALYLKCHNKYMLKMANYNDTMESAYDIVVVGGGTAGCVIASRLSEEPDLHVLLIEAGEEKNDDPRVTTPGLYPYMLGDSSYAWQYTTEPQVRVGPFDHL